MNIAFKGLRMPLTDEMKKHVRTALAPLEKILPDHVHVYAEVGKTSNHHRSGDDIYQASITLDTKGHMHFASVTDGDAYKAIDRAGLDIVESVKQNRGRKQTLARRGRMIIKRLTKSAFYE
ncbi:MAG: hypothetical protein JWM20_944 [Patescibacteria group bacterium]|nr:hypothetical protein [Patescibacteria group bacterium]